MKVGALKGFCFAVLGATLLTSLPFGGPREASAYDVQIHGYGNQDFIMTNKNDFLGAEEGTWDHNTMSLVFTANVTDDTSVWAKIFARSEKTSMEWLYVDYKAGGGVDLRIGQMKLPIGIFNLIRDMKFLHLAETDPYMYSEEVDLIFENFRGVEVEYNTRWFNIDVIGGAPEMEESEEAAEWEFDLTPGAGTLTMNTEEVEVRNLIGGRLTLKTPLEGLKLMFSGATFHEERTMTEIFVDLATATITETVSPEEVGREKLWVASLDLERGHLDVKAEYARKSGMDEQMISYYGEAGYTVFEKLTPFVRYDYIATDRNSKGDPAFYQKDTTVGIGYHVNDYFKVKVENHFINGYGLAVATGDVDPTSPDAAERWNMLVAGVNFMF